MKKTGTRCWSHGLAVFIVLISALAAVSARSEGGAAAPATVRGDWPRWRGPNNDNAPALANFPQDLGKGLEKVWTVGGLCTETNSQAWACPVVAGGRLIVTGRQGGTDVVFCLSAQTGAQLWKQAYDAPAGQEVPYGDGPRATPLIDGEMVYTFGCTGELACWSLAEGRQLWRLGLARLRGKRETWGCSSSPVIVGDTLFVQVGGSNLVVALDKRQGKVLWSGSAGRAGYAALTTVRIGGRDELLAFGADGLVSLSLDKGEQLWTFAWPTAFGMNCATPVMVGADKLLLCSTDYGNKGGVALLAFTNGIPETVWRTHAVGPAHNDPAILDGFAYAYTGFSLDKKGLCCFDLKDGAQKWITEQAGGPGNVVRVGNDLLCLGNNGMLVLVKPSPLAYQEVSRLQVFDANPSNGAPVWTEPIIANGRLYVRFNDQLVCYRIHGSGPAVE